MNSTYNRQEVQECLIVNMAQVLSREEYAKFKSALEEKLHIRALEECIIPAPPEVDTKRH